MKMRSTQRFILVSFLLAFAASCRPKDSDNDSSPAPDEDAFGLLGVTASAYKSDCIYKEESKTSEFEIITYGKNTFQRLWRGFDGKECGETTSRLNDVYKFNSVQKENETHLSGWSTFDFNYESIQITIVSDSVAKSFNETQAYGYSDWQLNQPKEVTGKRFSNQYATQPNVGLRVRSTIKLDGDTLSLARYVNGAPVEDRPYIYKKIKP